LRPGGRRGASTGSMTNRLAGETSPYLLQHSENPVDWMPWGEPAFERARREDKPIFLSIGYAACHWCHVMAHESFEDPAVAEVLNREFVPVKVDREERPDVDSVYMDAVVALSGHGGWPLSVFLTPDGRPFYGGTYFPPVRRQGMPSFVEVLEAVSTAWRGDRSRLIETARRLTEHVRQTEPPGGGEPEPVAAIEARAMEALLRAYDSVSGGWGGAPKFPPATLIAWLLRRHRRSPDPMALDMAVHALQAMADGGLFDHLGGGFHRYAVDRTWTVPHFEKMLYDNALLARVYLEAWQVTRHAPFLATASATLDFMLRELRAPQGGFGASLDADSEGEEGRFYVWTETEIETAVDDPRALEALRRHFDLPAGGNFEGRFVLRRKLAGPPTSETQVGRDDPDFDRALALLREARSRRVRPALDDKVVTAWNGLALSAWATAARVRRAAEDLPTAQSLAAFLLDRLRPAGRLARAFRQGQARHPAVLEDYAALGEGLVDLYQVDFDVRWLQAAVDLAEIVLRDFADGRGGFFDTARNVADLPVRPRSVQDTPLPSGNAMAASLLLRLEALTGERRFGDAARPVVASMASTAARYPTAFPAWLICLDLSASPLPQLAIVGALDDPAFRALIREAHDPFLPRLVLAAGAPSADAYPMLLRGRELVAGRPTAYLCREFACRLPTTSPDELRGQLADAA